MDGFSTKAEILADFRCASRQIFVEAFADEENLPAGFEGKPLSSLCLVAGTATQQPTLGRVTMLTEMLIVQPIDKRISSTLDVHPSFSKLPLDVKERYGKIGVGMGEIALSKGLAIDPVLPMEAINATYMARLSDDSRVMVGVFDKPGPRMPLVTAKYFAEEALEFVRLNPSIQDEDTQNRRLHYEFDFEITPDLPLNGYETREFLLEYRRALVNEYNRWWPGVQAEPQTEEDRLIIDAIKSHMNDCAKAVEAAERILEQRNDYK